MDTLMERQLDLTGRADTSRQKWNAWVSRCSWNAIPRQFSGMEKQKPWAFKDGSSVEADFVVIAAGIRPNVELGAAKQDCRSTAGSL